MSSMQRRAFSRSATEAVVAVPVLPADRSAPLVVLVVEDEFLLRYEIAEHFGDCGWIVLEAATADQAVAMCRARRGVDVLVTDINLNGSRSTGWDVAATLRAAQPDIGVVYMSGNSIDRSRCVPGSLFFGKPCRATDLARACRDLAVPRALG
jgi:CheY-like chemotaxis protein